jgi:outer membrane lipoprotein SlyB
VISSITPVEKKGEGSAAGAILGGIVGGVLGHQVGSGRGQDAATVAGAIGGALVGNELSRSGAAVSHWEVRVRFDDGTNQMIRFDQEPRWRVGDKVRVENGRVVANN